MLNPYLHAGELPDTQLKEIYDYAMTFVERNNRDLMETLFAINLALHRDYEYAPGTHEPEHHGVRRATLNRRGVCQDFANLFIAMARLLGIPARYVCGYIHTGNNGENRVGADASHAWVQLYIPNVGWKGFDPTNGTLPHLDHVRIAYGRHYRDTAPTSRHALLAGVRVDVGGRRGDRGAGGRPEPGRRGRGPGGRHARDADGGADRDRRPGAKASPRRSRWRTQAAAVPRLSCCPPGRRRLGRSRQAEMGYQQAAMRAWTGAAGESASVPPRKIPFPIAYVLAIAAVPPHSGHLSGEAQVVAADAACLDSDGAGRSIAHGPRRRKHRGHQGNDALPRRPLARLDNVIVRAVHDLIRDHPNDLQPPEVLRRVKPGGPVGVSARAPESSDGQRAVGRLDGPPFLSPGGPGAAVA